MRPIYIHSSLAFLSSTYLFVLSFGIQLVLHLRSAAFLLEFCIHVASWVLVIIIIINIVYTVNAHTDTPFRLCLEYARERERERENAKREGIATAECSWLSSRLE